MKLEWETCFKAGISIFLLYLSITYWESAANLMGLLLGAASPMIIGCAIAYVVNILMSSYEKHYFPKSRNAVLVKTRRPVCMLLSFATLIAVVVLIVWLVVPQLVSCVQLITAELPGFIDSVIGVVEDWEALPETITKALEQVDWRTQVSKLLKAVATGAGSVVDVVVRAVSSVFSGIMTAVLSLIFAIYLLSSKETLSWQMRALSNRYLKKHHCEKLYYIMGVLNDCFHKYIVGQCTEAVILGSLCAVGMLILQLPYAAMIGALIGFTALIPVAGAYIGAGVGAFMILTVSPVKAVIFLVFIVVLQQLEGNLIYPKVVGSSMGLPGIWVLAAVTVGGGVMGIPGMLLGVPLAAAVYRLLRDDVKKIPTGHDESVLLNDE